MNQYPSEFKFGSSGFIYSILEKEDPNREEKVI